MNKTELESLLKKARLPEISGESLEMFPRRIVAGLKRNDPPPRPARSFSPHLAWALGLAACAVIAFATDWFGHLDTETGPIAATDPLASIKLIRETLAMFPNQVRAIVQDEDTILADSERVLKLFHDPRPGADIRIALAPCSPFSVTRRLMAETAELAERHDCQLHTHLCETRDEERFCLKMYGVRPVDRSRRPAG